MPTATSESDQHTVRPSLDEDILRRSYLEVSGDRIELISDEIRVPVNEFEVFRMAWDCFDEAGGFNKDLPGNLWEDLEKASSAIFRRAGDPLTASIGSFRAGKLHKHKHKHKSLLHKSIAISAGTGSYGGGGYSWPEIEVPWREIDRLYDLREESNWDRHWLPDPKSEGFKAPPDMNQLAAEIEVLRTMQEDLRRPESAFRRERIVVEASNDLKAYMDPLGADAATPAGKTAVMFQVILWLGSMIGQQYKARYNLPRPNVLDPTLEPFIPVPIYSSFPSNHAFQSFLIAEVFSRMVPEHGGASALFKAAWDVAVNREFAGLHYRSDTLSGMELARLCAPVIEEVLEDHRRGVRAEWLGESEEGGA